MSSNFKYKMHYHHVGIFVSDMDRSVKWYEEMLGYKEAFRLTIDVPGRGPLEACWIKHQDHYIELQHYKTPLRPFDENDYFGTLGTKHLSLWVSDEDFAGLQAYLESKNVDFFEKVRLPEELVKKPGGCGVMYIKDPDGIFIEIQENLAY